jgi:hypothetical protein
MERQPMVKTTRAQRKALFRVFQRDFPSWITPTKRRCTIEGIPPIVSVPSIQYRRFRKRVQPGPGCIMFAWHGMWLGIEPDGYTHS